MVYCSNILLLIRKMDKKIRKTLGTILGISTFLGAQELDSLQYNPSPDFNDTNINTVLENFPSINPEDMVLDSTDISEVEVEPVYVPSVGEAIENSVNNARNIYTLSDARAYIDLNGAQNDLKVSMGDKKTSDDDHPIIMGNLRYIRNDLEDTLEEWDKFPRGTATENKISTIKAYLEGAKELSQKNLEKTEKDYTKFKKETQNLGTLPSELQEGIEGTYIQFEDRMNDLQTRLTEFDSTINYISQNEPKAKGFDDLRKTFRFSGDDDSQAIVKYLQTTYTEAQLEFKDNPALFASWVKEYFNPEVKEIIELYDDVLDERYVNPSRIEKLAKKSDGLIEPNLVNSINEERRNLLQAKKDLKALTKQDPYTIQEEKVSFSERWNAYKSNKLEKKAQNKLRLKQKEDKIKSDYEGAINDVVAGFNVGEDFSEKYAGLRLGNFEARASYGKFADETLVDFENSSVKISKKNEDLNSFGIDAIYHMGENFYVGTGLNDIRGTQKVFEGIYRNGVLVDPNRESKSIKYNSGDVLVGCNLPMGDIKMGIEMGYNNKKGRYGGLRVSVPLNKPRDKLKSKK